MEENIRKRLNSLIREGKSLTQRLEDSNGEIRFWVDEFMISIYQKWLASAYNLVSIISNPGSYYFDEATKCINFKPSQRGIPSDTIIKIYGLLLSLKEEIKNGLLKKIEFIFGAITFDNFLDHADYYHKANKKVESSVLASAVLEDTLKKIYRKNINDSKGLSLEEIINDLVRGKIFTPVKGKRIKSYAGIRNHAFHAEWDEFDIKDVGELIKGLRKIIDDYV